MTSTAPVLLLVGGGRWARVYLSVIARLAPLVRQVVVVSAHGGNALADAVKALDEQGIAVQIAPTLDAAIPPRGSTAAIVVNNARLHASTAQQLLERGIPVLLEKPFALLPSDAENLTAVAMARGAALVPGLVFSHCNYLEKFAQAAHAALGQLSTVEIIWGDAAGESRYGEAKKFDMSLNVIEEMGAHPWTLLTVLLGHLAHNIRDVEIEQGGLGVRLTGKSQDCAFDIRVGRNAPARTRSIVLRDVTGRQARLEFAHEPGTMTIANRPPCTADETWNTRPSPLTQQVSSFLVTAASIGVTAEREIITACTAFEFAAAERIRAVQHDFLRSAAGRNDTGRLVAMRELLATPLIQAGLLTPGDNRPLDGLASAALKIFDGAAPRADQGALVGVMQSAAITPAR